MLTCSICYLPSNQRTRVFHRKNTHRCSNMSSSSSRIPRQERRDYSRNSGNSAGAPNSTNSHHHNIHTNNVQVARQVSTGSSSFYPPAVDGNNNNNNEMPLLDLHGYQEGPAIRALTDFLKQHKNNNNNCSRSRNNHGTWVRIITGAGSHSVHDGPNLRPAVQSLLQRRQMTYTMDTPASFCVDAASGVTFCASSAAVAARRQHEPRIQVVRSSDLPADGVVVVGRPIAVVPTTTATATATKSTTLTRPPAATATVSAQEAASAPTASCERCTVSSGDYCTVPAVAHSGSTTCSTSGTTSSVTAETNSSRRSASSIVNTWWKDNSDKDPQQTMSNPEMEQVAQAREAPLAEAAAAADDDGAAAASFTATLMNDALEEVLAISRKEYERQELDDYEKGRRSIDDEDDDFGKALALSRNEYEQHVVQEEAAVQKAIDLSKQQGEAERHREEKLLQAALQKSQEIREMMRQEEEEAMSASCERHTVSFGGYIPSHSTSLIGTATTVTNSSRRSASSIVNTWWKHNSDEGSHTSEDNNNDKMPLLDLQGFRERPAVRALTDFLEQHKNDNNNNSNGCWVRIITGTGSHSFGPILRPTVQRLLERRQIVFTIDTPASFCVDAESGVTLQESQREIRDMMRQRKEEEVMLHAVLRAAKD